MKLVPVPTPLFLGLGQNGFVYQDSTKKNIAKKYHLLSEEDGHSYKTEGVPSVVSTEYHILMTIKHPNIVRGYRAEIIPLPEDVALAWEQEKKQQEEKNKSNNNLKYSRHQVSITNNKTGKLIDAAVLSMEKCDINLNDWIKKELEPLMSSKSTFSTSSSTLSKHSIKKTQVINLIFQMFSALAKLEMEGIIHGDLKPSNIMLILPLEDKEEKEEKDQAMSIPITILLKLIDFGLAQYTFKQLKRKILIQSSWYRAPEVILGYRFYNTLVDIWSVGVILIQMIFLLVVSTEMTNMKKLLQDYIDIFDVPTTPFWKKMVSSAMDAIKDADLTMKKDQSSSSSSSSSFGEELKQENLKFLASLVNNIDTTSDINNNVNGVNSKNRHSSFISDTLEFFEEKKVDFTTSTNVTKFKKWIQKHHPTNYNVALKTYGEEDLNLLIDLITKCLQLDFTCRTTARRACQHVIFQKYSSSLLIPSMSSGSSATILSKKEKTDLSKIDSNLLDEADEFITYFCKKFEWNLNIHTHSLDLFCQLIQEQSIQKHVSDGKLAYHLMLVVIMIISSKFIFGEIFITIPQSKISKSRWPGTNTTSTASANAHCIKFLEIILIEGFGFPEEGIDKVVEFVKYYEKLFHNVRNFSNMTRDCKNEIVEIV